MTLCPRWLQNTWSAISIRARTADFSLRSKPPLLTLTYYVSVEFSYLQIVLTCEKPIARARASQRQNYKVGHKEPLPPYVEKKLFQLFYLELMLAANSEMMRQDLVS